MWYGIMITIEKHLLGPLSKVSIMVWPYFMIWMRFSTKSQLFAKSIKKRNFPTFLKNMKNQCLGCSDRSDMFGDGKSMFELYFQDVGMIGKILKSNFFWKIFMLFFIKVFLCYFPLRAFSSWYFPYVLKQKIIFSEKSFGRMQNLTEVCWTKVGSKNTFSVSFWALERYFANSPIFAEFLEKG